MDSDFAQIKEKVKSELADYLGLEPADIEDDSSLTEDLHMKASDLTDFMEVLTRMGIETASIDLTEHETFIDLVEAITERE